MKSQIVHQSLTFIGWHTFNEFKTSLVFSRRNSLMGLALAFFKINWQNWFQEQLVQENAARQAVTQALQKKMEDDKRDLTQTMVKGTEELKQKLEEDKKELVEKLDGETGLIKARIETVKDETKNEQKRLETEMTKGKESLAERLRRENEEIQARMKRDAEERAKRETEMKAGNLMIQAWNSQTKGLQPF